MSTYIPTKKSIQFNVKATYFSLKMVNTRSLIKRENQNERSEIDEFIDDEDNVSVADHYSGSYFNDNNDNNVYFLPKNQFNST